MAGPLEFFGDVIGGTGKFIGDVGQHLGTGLRAVRDAKVLSWPCHAFDCKL